MALVRRQRRLAGKKQNYWLCTETGTEYLSKPKSGCTESVNGMFGLMQWVWLADADGIRSTVYDAFGRFCAADASDTPGISINRLIHLADTQPVLYSVRHPDSLNSPEYDAALTLLLRLVQPYLDEWREEFSTDTETAASGGIHQLMQELGYNTGYDYRRAAQAPGSTLDIDSLLYCIGN